MIATDSQVPQRTKVPSTITPAFLGAIDPVVVHEFFIRTRVDSLRLWIHRQKYCDMFAGGEDVFQMFIFGTSQHEPAQKKAEVVGMVVHHWLKDVLKPDIILFKELDPKELDQHV